MARYYFNVHDGTSVLDKVGTDLPDISAARKEALQIAEGLFDSAELRADLGEEWRIEVMNDTGTLMFRMEFIAPELETIHPIERLAATQNSRRLS